MNKEAPKAASNDANFGDLSFLDDVDSFNSAEAARAKYVAEAKRLEKKRYDTAHIYYDTKRKEMTAAAAKAEFDVALTAKIAKHKAAQGAKAYAAT
jgi:hypothetical protein